MSFFFFKQKTANDMRISDWSSDVCSSDLTTKLYTDFGLLTANPSICEDTDRVFSLLTGLGARRPLKLLLQSPLTLHETMVALIKAEAAQEIARASCRVTECQ